MADLKTLGTIASSLAARYTFVRSLGAYRDIHRRRLLQPDEMEPKIKRALGSLYTPSIRDQVVALLKDLGTDEVPAKVGRPASDKQARLQALRDAYTALAPHLSLRRYYDGQTTKVYALRDRGEVDLVGQLDEDLFIEYITGNLRLNELAYSVWDESAFLCTSMELLDLLRYVYSRFRVDGAYILHKEPQVISWDPATPAYKVLDSSTLVEGATPNWDSLLSRSDFPETFKAYIWSIFEPANRGRQALWLYGGGWDGKSSAIKAIARFLGDEHTLTLTRDSHNDSFFFGNAFKKRLAVYPECKNYSILRSERIKSLLGGDIASINNKYDKVFSAHVYAKIIIGANQYPEINSNDDSELTRLLLIQLKENADKTGDPHFEDNLVAEMPHFLFSCRESYARECIKDTNLRLPPDMSRAIRVACSANDSELIEHFIQERLVFKSGSATPKKELRTALRHYFMDNGSAKDLDNAFRDLTRLLSKRGVSFGEQASGESTIRVYTGIDLLKTDWKKARPT